MQLPLLRSRTATLVFLCLALTIGHVAYRAYMDDREGPYHDGNFSKLEIGQLLPPLVLLPLEGTPRSRDLPFGQCRILVAFSTSCLHCHSASARDAARPADSLRLPMVWISDLNNAKAREFETTVRAGSIVVYGGADAFRKLKPRGVPIGFLVGADNRIKHIFPVSGLENHVTLRKQC